MYLITGGSGYLGEKLIEKLNTIGIFNIRVVARNEGNLVKIKERFPIIEILPGSISDKFICDKACSGVKGIFHLAAFKHVSLAEENTRECIDSNVIGTMNLLECTRINKPDFILGISTDKAAKVEGVYSATKLLQERLFAEYERINPETKYRTVRFGNILYSTGSVLCKWKERLERGEKVIITDPRATRFFWTVDDAVNHVFECIDNATDSTPYCSNMKSIMMGDLLTAMAEKYLPADKTLLVEEIGLQPGENLHEIIENGGLDSSKSERFSKEEIMSLI